MTEATRLNETWRERKRRLEREWQRRQGPRWRERRNRLQRERRADPEYRERKSRLRRERHKAHPEIKRAIKHRRRARKRNAPGDHNGKDIKMLLAVQEGECFYCYGQLNGVYDVEHKIPLSRGGSNGPENLALACRSCNSRKRTRTAKEFRQYLKTRGRQEGRSE